jgi:adsorption protein B
MRLPAATRAYFPMTFTAAVRQKTRWLIGICLQSWENVGWVGNAWFRFALYHDRKAVVTNIVNILAYVVLAYILLYELARWGLTDYGTLRPIIRWGTPLHAIVMIDTAYMLWRFLNRFITVRRVYGFVPGLLSIVRLPVGNFINFSASVRGIGQYIASRLRKTNVTWDKTTHTHYPGMRQKSA